MYGSLGALGTGNSKTNGATVTITTTQDANVGDVIVVATAWDNDNLGGGGSTGPMDEYLSCTDTAGNSYQVAAGAQDTSAGTASASHACIFVCKVEAFLASGSTITVTELFQIRVAKAVTAELFSDDGGNVLVTTRVHVHTVAADPASITISGLDSGKEYLLVWCLGAEGPNTDAYTLDADYSAGAFGDDGTTGGAANSNMHVRAAYRIATGLTGDTVDVTSTTADRDYTQVLVAIESYDAAPFPATGILDDFNRADEDPLTDGGNWDSADGYGATSGGPLQLTTNQVRNDGATFVERSTWGDIFADSMEAWATRTAVGADDQEMSLVAGATTDRTSATFDCYLAAFGLSAAPTSALTLYSVLNGVMTVIGSAAPPGGAGSKSGIRVESGIVEVWEYPSGGPWHLAISVRDTTYSGGQIGLGIKNTTHRWDDFGGGGPTTDTIPPPIGIALETDIAYPFNGANEDASGTGAAADTIDVPGSPGTLTITGLPFEPTWVFIVASDATADDTWQSGTSCMSRGLGGMDPGGSLFQTVTRMVFDATTQVASGYDEGHIIEVASARGAMGANLLVKATLTGFTADGFTLSFSNVSANTKFHYLAGDQAAALSDISFATLAGLTWDNTPAGGIYLGLSDAASSAVPRNWNGGAYTAQVGAGRIAEENESPESDFIWWDPGYNTTQHFNGIDGPLNDWAGIFNDIWFFGSVLRRPMQMFRVANDVLIRDAGAWVASLLVLADTYAQATSGDAGDSVSDVADITWADPDFTPAALVHIQGSTVGFAAEDPDHTGASIGVATKDNMWVVALSSKHGFGASIYRSDALSWISAWDPHDVPTDMSAGTSIPILNGARVTTVVADVPTNMHVGVAGLGQGVVFGPISMNWRYAIRKGVATRALFNDEVSAGS